MCSSCIYILTVRSNSQACRVLPAFNVHRTLVYSDISSVVELSLCSDLMVASNYQVNQLRSVTWILHAAPPAQPLEILKASILIICTASHTSTSICCQLLQVHTWSELPVYRQFPNLAMRKLLLTSNSILQCWCKLFRVHREDELSSRWSIFKFDPVSKYGVHNICLGMQLGCSRLQIYAASRLISPGISIGWIDWMDGWMDAWQGLASRLF